MQLLSKSKLLDWYVSKHLSTWAIEKKYGYSRSVVYKKLKDYKIAPRSLAASHFKTSRKIFDGSLEERAYLVGFAVGDLRVRLHNKKGRSETISIACSSSKLAQIKLIRDLFSSYGHIWEGQPNYRGIVSIEAFVDLSFNFLFKDKNNVEDNLKLFKKRSHFLSFLAGFSDAEGSIFISRGMAQMSWGNYDKKILDYIKNGLTKINVRTGSINNDHLKGYKGKDGYKRNKNYYHLCCAEKSSLEKLLNMLKQYIRHGDKIKSSEIALNNIQERNKKFPWTIKRKTFSI